MGFFHHSKNDHCPLCGKNMKSVNGEKVCAECGYRSSYGASSVGNQPAPSAVPHISYAHTCAEGDTAARKKSSSKKLGAIIFAVAFILPAFCILLSTFFIIRISSPQPVKEKTAPIREAELSGAVEVYDDALQIPGDTMSIADLPLDSVTEGMRNVLEFIFDKDISELTLPDLYSVTSLDFHYDDRYYRVVSYELTSPDGETASGSFYPRGSDFYNMDFSIFPNLEALSMEYGRIGSIGGLRRLRTLSVGMSPARIAELTDPGQITSLSLLTPSSAEDLSALFLFKNLKSLTIDSDYLKNLNSLPDTTKTLESFTLYGGDSLTSFKAINNMTNLRQLSLACPNLRDISFLSNMPYLESLTIEGSKKLSDLTPLSSCADSLTCLNLSFNEKIKDYEAVTALTRLEELTLLAHYSSKESYTVPSLEHMTNLTKLRLENLEGLSNLRQAPKLQSLSVCAYNDDFTFLESLTKLKQLTFSGMSIDPELIASVADISTLTDITLDNCYVWGNAERLLQAQNLKEFHLLHTTAGFDVTNLTANESLEVLDFNRFRLLTLENGEWDYHATDNLLSLSEHADIFLNYPNLKKLSITDYELSDAELMELIRYLPSSIEVLDLSSNALTDLTPLSSLPSLKNVICYNNLIEHDGGLGCRVGFNE